MADDAAAPALACAGLTMEFPGVRALDDVSFAVRSGSVHALMGENGAGKSTLLKILSGAYRPSGGTVRIDGAPRTFGSTAAAIAAGVAVIYQELHVVPTLSVAENLLLGRLPRSGPWLDRAALRCEAARLLELVGEDLDPEAPVGRLSLAQRQMVEIAKALGRGARIVAFDEPTSSLSTRETERLFAIIRGLRERGCAVLYVSHRMDEIYEVCDAATVLRDGRHVCTHAALASLPRAELVRAMVGRDLVNVFHYEPRPRAASGLEVRALAGPGLAAPVSFQVAGGEIVGFFGLVGAGRTELMRLVCGVTRRTAGEVRVGGEAISGDSPRAAIRAGLVFCPEDRKKEGIVPVRAVAENINLSARRLRVRAGLFLDEAWERDNAATQIARLRIKTASLATPIRLLSGGNQQKAILARWLSEPVRAIVLDEPTRGIDIGAKSEIYALIHELAAAGAAVVIVSSELPEVLGLSDRVCVMRSGHLAAEFPRAAATPEAVLQAALPLAAAV